MSQFRTSDLALSSVLYALNIPFEYVDKTNTTKAEFVFKRVDGLDDIIQAYFAKSLSIEPMLLLSSFKAIKTRLYHVDSTV